MGLQQGFKVQQNIEVSTSRSAPVLKDQDPLCFQNVFIAVITETFAEIRVQFSEMWQKKDVTFDEEFRQVSTHRPFSHTCNLNRSVPETREERRRLEANPFGCGR